MNYELAKKLKDVGFPFKEHDDDHIRGYQIATLSELIEACGAGFLNLYQMGTKMWMCNLSEIKTEKDSAVEKIQTFNFQSDGATPEEAVANLWIKLQK